MASPNTVSRTNPLEERRRALRVVLAGCVGLLPSTGCKLFDWPRFGEPDLPKPPAPDFTKAQIVSHLNQNIDKLESWRSSDVRITARQDGGFPIKLSAFVAVDRPRNLRIRAKSMLRGDEVDFGSNDDGFWVWLRESPQKVVFTAKHDEVHRVQTRLHLPFDPDWLIEALGVVPIDPSLVALERTDPRGEVVDLFEERILANGQRVKVATTVDVRRGLIVGRTLYDPRGGLVARASITKHRVHDHDQPHGGVVMPHEVRLEWPTVKTVMNLSIGRIDVNPRDVPVATFQIPTIKGCPECRIAEEMDRLQRSATLPVKYDKGFEFEN